MAFSELIVLYPKVTVSLPVRLPRDVDRASGYYDRRGDSGEQTVAAPRYGSAWGEKCICCRICAQVAFFSRASSRYSHEGGGPPHMLDGP